MTLLPPESSLTALEVASGLVLGVEREHVSPSALKPIEALERALLRALHRPPCLVSFSGGRDSSAVLALATRVARREGLPLPIPATNRFPLAPDTHENEWQEVVVRHLGLADWLRLEHHAELDAVGPYAQTVLRRHGLLWPFNAHFHVPLFAAAAGGSMLTGIFGDEMLSQTTWHRQLDVLAGRIRPEVRDAGRLAYFCAPRPLRRRYVQRRFPLAYAWLRPDARREVARAWAAQMVTEPRRARSHVVWRGRMRYQKVGDKSLKSLAADVDVLVVHPFGDRTFRAAFSRMPLTSRSAAFKALLGGILPDAVLTRSTKSNFDRAFFARHAREFAHQWEGGGIDPDIVDPDALAAEWRSRAPDPRSFLLMQAVWLGTLASHDVQHQVDRRLERFPVSRPA